MSAICDVLYVLFLATDLLLVTSSRLLHCINLIAWQSVLIFGISLLQVAAHGTFQSVHFAMVLVNLLLKAIVIPYLLAKMMRSVQVQRELKPIVGYSLSGMTAVVLMIVSYLVCRRIDFCMDGAPVFANVAFSTILIGLFLVMVRKSALMQVIGFLVFENGISLFVSGMSVEYSVAVELGILLDVLILVCIMGIAVFLMMREFHHIDADRLNRLGDSANAGQNYFAVEEE